MKRSFRILALSMFALLGSTAAFATDWVVPTPVYAALNAAEAGSMKADTVYLWNVGQAGFVAGGEAWGTQATILSSTTEKWVIQKTTEDGVYKIANAARSGKFLFRTSTDGKVGSGVKTCFVDGGDNNDTWAIASVGTNIYSIQRPESAGDVTESIPFDANAFLGVQLDHQSGAAVDGVTHGLYWDVTYAGNEANCQFAFITQEGYKVYAAKQTLKGLLEDGENRGVDVTAEGAVFNNVNATEAEVNAAIDAINKKISAVVTPDNPQDLTSMVKNATFDNGVDGWSYSTGAQNHGTATNVSNDANNNNEKAFAGNFFENWNPNTFKGHMYQTIKGLPEGVYQVGIAAFVNGLDDNNAVNQKQYVYANDVKVLLSRANARAYTITLSLQGTDTLQVGLASDSTICNWMGIDNITVKYLGNGIESYRYLSKQVLADVEKSIQSTAGDVYYTQSVYDAAVAACNVGIDATDNAASYDGYLKAKQALADLQTNINAYATLNAQAQYDEDQYWNHDLSDQEELIDAANEAYAMYEEHTASTEEVLAMIQKLADVLQQAKLNSYNVGDDVTSLITNPTFNDETAEANYSQPQSKVGWIGADAIGSGWITDTRLAEVYDKDCNIHQDLKGLKKGAYRLSIQAFYRPAGATPENYQKYLNGDSLTNAYIYMGLTQQRVKSIYACTFPESITTVSRENHWVNVGTDADGNVLYVPNTMDEAYVAFNGSTAGDQDPAYDNNYRNIVYGVVTEAGGTMPIGFKIENHASTSWVIFRDFRLEYLGNDPQYIKPVLDNKIAEATGADYTNKKMEADAQSALAAAVAEGQTATAGTDGDAMMNAFTAIAQAEAKADTSIAKYAELKASLDSLQNEYANDIYAAEDARTTAKTLIDEVTAAYNNGTIAQADIPAKQAEMKAARRALMLQDGSDDEPATYTSWILNPRYDKQDGWQVNKTSGDGTPGIQYNTMEIWNATADVYQDIEGLPEGTYQVQVKGVFRPVSGDEAWKDLLGDSIEDYSRARIYANNDSVAPRYWALKYDQDSYSWTTGAYLNMVDSVLDETADTMMAVDYHLANDRNAMRYQFDMGNTYPVISFYTYVASDGHLRLGFRNSAHKVQDWFVVSDWELYYYGTNSSHAVETGISEIAKPEKVTFNEIYTIDGQRVSRLQRGINIVRGKTADGRTVTKKILVK